MRILFLLALLLPLACAAQAATIYRSVDADGKVTYSSEPPGGGTVEKTLNFTDLPASPLPESVLRYQKDLEKGAQKRLSEAQRPAAGQPTLFMTQWCGYCKQAKAYFAEKGIQYQEHDIETPAGMHALVASGIRSKGVPVLLWNGHRLQGYSRPAYDALFRSASR